MTSLLKSFVREMKTTTVSVEDLRQGLIPYTILEEAFGESSLGILIVKDLPGRYGALRMRLLSYASYLAQLPMSELDSLTNAAAHYEIGWSHGKEALKDGKYDTMKGSFYVDCQSFYLENPVAPKPGPASTRGAGFNLWPPEQLIPGFRQTFEELCTLLIDIGVLVARAMDLYAVEHIESYRSGYLENIVKTSHTTKARLLHYFPLVDTASGSSSACPSADSFESEDDSWCATHLDDGCLTALTSALYIDESAPLPPVTSQSFPALKALPTSPDPKAGLYIRSRNGNIVRVDVPPDCLAFQTGEALQMITEGKFKAVPHFVKGPEAHSNVARNTLAVFMQPNVEEVIDQEKGTTYGEFVKMVIEKHS